jgi:hypothetical protein
VRQVKYLRNKINFHLSLYLELPNPPEYDLVINVPPGVGKTVNTVRELDRHDSFFEYLVPQHKFGMELIKTQPELWGHLQIESRRRLCHHVDYVKLASYGINIKHMCKECEYQPVCEYYARIIELWNEPQSWVGVHSHLGGLANAYAYETGVDVVVLDENFLNSIFKNYKFGYPLVLSTYNLLGHMEDCAEKTLIQEFLQEFIFSFQNKKLNTIYLYSLIYEYFHERGHDYTTLSEFAVMYEIALINRYFTKKRLFNNIITPLVDSIIDIHKKYVPMSVPNHLDYINSVFVPHIGQRQVFMSMCRYDLEALDLPCKTIILDATTPPAFYEKLIGRQVKTLEGDIDIGSYIYQVSSAKYVMRTLDKNEDTLDRLHKIVGMISKKHESQSKTLVLSRKKYKAGIKAVDPDNILVDHYPLRGSNDYEDCNVVVAFGTPEPRRDVLRRSATLLKVDEDELMYLMREANILQGVHRIRPALKRLEPTYIYLLTSLDLPFSGIRKMPIGKLERFLSDELDAYVTEETEDRIREEIMTILEKNGEMTITSLTRAVTGKNSVVSEILHRMIEEEMIYAYRKSKGRGRPATYCRSCL